MRHVFLPHFCIFVTLEKELFPGTVYGTFGLPAGHHLQNGPRLRRRPSKKRTLTLETLEKTGPRNLVETKDQIEYISRYSNSAKNKDQNSNIPRKAGYSKLPNHF